MNDEIWLLVVGALISFLSTLIYRIVDNWLDGKGNVKIYSKRIYNRNLNGKSTGFYSLGSELVLFVPLWVEIQNSKKIPTIIRDFSIYLYRDGIKLSKMKQISDNLIAKDGVEKSCFYGDRGRYSFIIEATSIMRFELLFSIKSTEFSEKFDELRIIYFNERDKKVETKFMKIDKPWITQEYGVDIEWTFLK